MNILQGIAQHAEMSDLLTTVELQDLKQQYEVLQKKYELQQVQVQSLNQELLNKQNSHHSSHYTEQHTKKRASFNHDETESCNSSKRQHIDTQLDTDSTSITFEQPLPLSTETNTGSSSMVTNTAQAMSIWKGLINITTKQSDMMQNIRNGKGQHDCREHRRLHCC